MIETREIKLERECRLFSGDAIDVILEDEARRIRSKRHQCCAPLIFLARLSIGQNEGGIRFAIAEIDRTRLQGADAVIETQTPPLWIEALLFRDVGAGDDRTARDRLHAAAKIGRRQWNLSDRGGKLWQSGKDRTFEMSAGRVANRQTCNRCGGQRLDAAAKGNESII